MTGLQRYVSNELTHFVGRGRAEGDQYRLLVKIINERWLTSPPHVSEHGAKLMIDFGVRLSANEMFTPQVVCFCDIPVSDLELHIRKYSHFGLAFQKTFLVQRGANPVFYIVREAPIHKFLDSSEQEAFSDDLELFPGGPEYFLQSVKRSVYFDHVVEIYHKVFMALEYLVRSRPQDLRPSLPTTSEFEVVRHLLEFYVFSFMKFFDASKAEDDPDNYYMEREWRMLGNLHFELGNVCRVILPQSYARQFRTDVPDYFGQITFVE